MRNEKTRRLKLISPDKIKPNPDNPRMIFRQDEMDSLMVSISRFGIQVPLTVYEEEPGYRLIDGERRWRTALKLNLPEIPALIQEKPSPLLNLVLMYHIHAFREQWDYFTIASKLPRVQELFFEEQGRTPNEVELSELTGLTRGQIRRCRLLTDLSERYKKILINELELPKNKQRLSEDFFIEMERALKTVAKRIPRVRGRIDDIRDVLISKYRQGIINNVTDFRSLSKIATAIDNLDITRKTAEKALNLVFDKDNEIGILDVYQRGFEFRYDEKKAFRHIEGLTDYLDSIISEYELHELKDEFVKQIRMLYRKLKKLLEE